MVPRYGCWKTENLEASVSAGVSKQRTLICGEFVRCYGGAAQCDCLPKTSPSSDFQISGVALTFVFLWFQLKKEFRCSIRKQYFVAAGFCSLDQTTCNTCLSFYCGARYKAPSIELERGFRAAVCRRMTDRWRETPTLSLP
jgi:hypothetical protein